LGVDPLAARVNTYDIETLRIRPVHTYVKNKRLFCYQQYHAPSNLHGVISAKSKFSNINFDKKPLDIHRVEKYHQDTYNNIHGSWKCYRETYIGVEYADKAKYLNTLSVLVSPWEFLDYAKLCKSAGMKSLPRDAIRLWEELLARFSLNVSFQALKSAKVQDEYLLTRALSVLQEIFPALERWTGSSEYISLTYQGEILTDIKVYPSSEDHKALLTALGFVRALVEENLDKLAMTVIEVDRKGDSVISDYMRSSLMPYLTVDRNLPSHSASEVGMGKGNRGSSMIPIILVGSAVGAIVAQST
jgi:hypothetical protein